MIIFQSIVNTYTQSNKITVEGLVQNKQGYTFCSLLYPKIPIDDIMDYLIFNGLRI